MYVEVRGFVTHDPTHSRPVCQNTHCLFEKNHGACKIHCCTKGQQSICRVRRSGGLQARVCFGGGTFRCGSSAVGFLRPWLCSWLEPTVAGGQGMNRLARWYLVSIVATASAVSAQSPAPVALPSNPLAGTPSGNTTLPTPQPVAMPALPASGSSFDAMPMPTTPSLAAPVTTSVGTPNNTKQINYTYGPPSTPAPSNSSTIAVPITTPAPLQAPSMMTVATLITGPAMLSVKQQLPETISLGQTVTSSVTVTNSGGKAAEQVTLTGWWSSGYELIEAGQVAAPGSGKRAWGLGTLQAGETRTVEVKFQPQSGTTVTEFRSGFDATFSSATDSKTVKVTKPELQLSVDSPTTAFVGQPVQVLLKIKNPSGSAIKQVTIRTLLSDVVSHPKGSDLENELASIAAGATEIIPLNMTVIKGGEGRLRVRIGGQGCESVEQEVKVTTMEARMTLTMGGPKTLYQNWPATYETVIENQGDQAIRGVSYEVKLPSGFTDLRASDGPGYDAASHRIVWKFDQLKPGEKKTILWFGFGKQTEDLTMTGTLTVGGSPVKRGEYTTKNMGAEQK